MNPNENVPSVDTAAPSQAPGLFDSSDFDALLNREHDVANSTPATPPPLPTPGAPQAQPQPPTDPTPQQPTAPPAQTPVVAPTTPTAPTPTTPTTPTAPPAQPTQPPVAASDEEIVDLGVAQNGSAIKIPRKQVREALQMVAQLNEGYNGWRQEGEKFQKVFGMPAAQAEQVWGELITDVNEDPGLADYLQQAWDGYKTWRGGNPVSNAEKLAADANKRSLQLEKENEQRRVNELQQYVENEKRTLQTSYPLLNDPSLWKVVVQHSMIEAARDKSYTLTRGVSDLWPLLQRMSQNQTVQPVQETAAPVEVPALLTGSGASPTGTSSPATMDEKVFDNLDDAQEDWVRNRRSLGFN